MEFFGAVAQAVVVTIIFLSLLFIAQQRARLTQGGWKWILLGWAIILLGTISHIASDIGIDQSGIFADNAKVRLMLDNVIAFQLGYLFIFAGLIQIMIQAPPSSRSPSCDFASTISHELRTPMTSIYGSLRLLNNAPTIKDLPENVRQILDISLRNSERMMQLINDIVDLQHIEAGSISLNLQTHDSQELCATALLNSNSYADNYRVHFQLQPPAQPLRLTVDAERFYQIMNNLLRSAARYSRPGNIITIRVIQQNNCGRIEFLDQEQHVDKNILAQLFAPVDYSIPPSTRQDGIGLSISISRQLAHMMGGEIGCEINPQNNSIFYFDLPMKGTD
ncbi:MAG: HAMP domain-containing histidine kinase [Gammaproteobacteria bacterium]|nr:HAMP domain-containing histidine kinase [Gammaproteobacteria bacterium]